LGTVHPGHVSRPILALIFAELAQVFPRVQARVVAIIEDQLDRVLAYRLYGLDSYILLAKDQNFLPRAMSLYFGGR
jgi:hypothetical protein